MSQLAEILTGAGMVGIGAGTAAAEHDAFGGSTLTVAGLLSILGAQEADKAAAWRIADLEAMAALLGDAAPERTGGWTLTELDADWARFSDALIAAHAAAEAAGDAARDQAFLTFYRESAARRALIWPI
jgi:hypothetical protein